MITEERQILEEIRDQNRGILRLLRGEGDGGLRPKRVEEGAINDRGSGRLAL